MSEFLFERFTGDGSEWNAMIARLPNTHLLQTWEWSQVKSAYGWEMMPVTWRSLREGAGTSASAGSGATVAAAMVLKRRVLGRGFVRRLSILYAPKGPLLDWNHEDLRDRVLDDLQQFAKRSNAIFLKIDPDVELGRGYALAGSTADAETGSAATLSLQRRNWRFSADQVQFRNTVALDLSQTEDALLARMKQKARYNVRLAERKGVTVRLGSPHEIPALYQLYAETSVRDGFVIRTKQYYERVWGTFLGRTGATSDPFAEVLVAEVDKEMIAAVFVFYFARRAYYLYGMSAAAHRDKMPNHLLQWEAIRRAKSHGCLVYDLWGAPDAASEQDPMWGVYRFKEGLGGDVVRTVGAWDFPASPLWYSVYTRIVPRILDVMRARGRQRVRASLGGT